MIRMIYSSEDTYNLSLISFKSLIIAKRRKILNEITSFNNEVEVY